MANPLGGMPRLPKWLNDLMIAEDVAKFAPPPSLNHIVARSGMSEPMSTEDFLRSLLRDSQAQEELAASTVDASYSPDANIFGSPVKTIEQGRSLGARNLPGIESLSPEDQLVLASALDKGAILRAMPATATDTRAAGDRWASGPKDRAEQITGVANPFFPLPGLTQGEVMASLGNKRDFRRLTGASADAAALPNPEALNVVPGRAAVPSKYLDALGDDVRQLAMAVRKDQIDSLAMQSGEAADAMRQAELDAAMSESADAVARQEARARDYENFPPETLSKMDKANRSELALQSGRTAQLTQDPLYDIARQAREPSPVWDSANESSTDAWMRTDGNDIMKGLGLGHILSYPVVYGMYKAMYPGQQATTQEPPQEPARQLAEFADEEERLYQEAQKAKSGAEMFDPVPVELPDMPLVTSDNLGTPDDPQAFLELDNPADLAAESSPPPTIADLDAELRSLGLKGIPSWYIRAMKDPAVKLIDGKPKEQFLPFTDKSKEYQIQQRYLLEGMTR